MNHWDSQAITHGVSYKASWGDGHAVALEFRNLSLWIDAGARVLDVGCATGHVAERVLEYGAKEVIGVDNSRPMIAAANKRGLEGAKFVVADARDTRQGNESFELVYSIRTLINLPDWGEQKKALQEIHRVLKRNCVYVLSEAFVGSLANLNQLRACCGLPPLEAPAINVYLHEAKLEDAIKSIGFEIVEINRFSSMYYLGTRVVRDLTAEGSQKDDWDGDCNRFFAGLQCAAGGLDCGVQKAYVLRKV